MNESGMKKLSLSLIASRRHTLPRARPITIPCYHITSLAAVFLAVDGLPPTASRVECRRPSPEHRVLSRPASHHPLESPAVASPQTSRYLGPTGCRLYPTASPSHPLAACLSRRQLLVLHLVHPVARARPSSHLATTSRLRASVPRQRAYPRRSRYLRECRSCLGLEDLRRRGWRSDEFVKVKGKVGKGKYRVLFVSSVSLALPALKGISSAFLLEFQEYFRMGFFFFLFNSSYFFPSWPCRSLMNLQPLRHFFSTSLLYFDYIHANKVPTRLI